jgi:hypothetical protein
LSHRQPKRTSMDRRARSAPTARRPERSMTARSESCRNHLRASPVRQRRIVVALDVWLRGPPSRVTVTGAGQGGGRRSTVPRGRYPGRLLRRLAVGLLYPLRLSRGPGGCPCSSRPNMNDRAACRRRHQGPGSGGRAEAGERRAAVRASAMRDGQSPRQLGRASMLVTFDNRTIIGAFTARGPELRRRPASPLLAG